jgi:hypothetical protein
MWECQDASDYGDEVVSWRVCRDRRGWQCGSLTWEQLKTLAVKVKESDEVIEDGDRKTRHFGLARIAAYGDWLPIVARAYLPWGN